MHKFVRNLLTEWRLLKLPFNGESFIVAVSGGADSVSLLLALHELRERKKLRNTFVIAHFNHALRGRESVKDAKFVEELARKHNFEFVVEVQNQKSKIKSQKGNLEQNARVARYQFLAEKAANFQAIGVLTAHTVNDQAETFLLNLIRGSGLSGLSGMKAVSSIFLVPGASFEEKSKIQNPKSKIQLVRPFLNWATRTDTENFCHEKKVEFRNDAMNEDLSFKRVSIRKILLPVLKEFNPKIVETLAKTANLLGLEGENLKEEPRKLGNGEIEFEKSEIVVQNLKTLSQKRLYEVLRRWLEVNRGNLRQLELKHIEAIERLILTRKSGRWVELPEGETIVKNAGKLTFQKRKVEKSGAEN